MRAQRHRAASMTFILVTLFLDVLGVGIVIPVLPLLITDLLDGDASAAARWYGLLISVFALMQFLFAPVLGALSDRFGRRPVILASLFGYGLNYLLLAWAPTLAWIFVARVTTGIFGASFTTANAYIADVSNKDNRAANFGLVGVAFGLGFICGPALGGLLGHFGPRVPFLVAAGVVLVNWLYGILVLPESLALEHRRPFSLREANPLGGLARLRRHPLVLGLAIALVFLLLGQRGLESVWVIYTQYRYGWSELENGLTLALFGIMAAVVQGGLVRVIVKRLGERRTVLIGLSVGLLGLVGYGASSSGSMLLGVIVVASLAGMAQPAMQGLVAGTVSASEQGAIQGALTSLLSLTAIVAPLVSTQAFGYFTGDAAPLELPGAPFFIGAVFGAVALVIMVVVFRRNPEDGVSEELPQGQGATVPGEGAE